MPQGESIESVQRAAQVLLMLSTRRWLRVVDVASEIGVSASTAHRLLSTLQKSTLVRQNPQTKAYGPGPALVEIGIAALGATDLLVESRAVLQRLTNDVRETSHLIVLSQTETVFIDGVEGLNAIRAGLRVGDHTPAYCGGAGKALLAELNTEEFYRRYPKEDLGPGSTSTSIRTRTALEADFVSIRRQGYATNFSESEDDLHAVSVVVRNRLGTARAAISVSAPAHRLPLESVPPLAQRIQEAASALGAVIN